MDQCKEEGPWRVFFYFFLKKKKILNGIKRPACILQCIIFFFFLLVFIPLKVNDSLIKRLESTNTLFSREGKGEMDALGKLGVEKGSLAVANGLI